MNSMTKYKLIFFQKVDSTNEMVFKLLKKGVNPPIAVVSEKQTKGRGRYGRKWYSEKGGIYLSFGLKGSFGLLKKLTLFSSLAVVEVILKKTSIFPEIVLPNDIYFEGKKLSGILGEIRGEDIAIGIGLNVNQTNFPEEVREKATSLFLITGRNYEEEDLVYLLVEKFDSIYRRISQGEEKHLYKEWKRYVSSIEKNVSFRVGKEEIRGFLLDIREDFKIYLREYHEPFDLFELRDFNLIE